MNSFEIKPKENYGFIYKYTSPSGKSYIGQTKYSLKERAKTSNGLGYQHCSVFYQAIQKYGFENFVYEILGEFPIEDLDKMEKIFIEKHKTIVPNGYNIQKGGAETEKKIYQSKKKTQIDQYDLTGKYIQTFESLRIAAEIMNTHYQSISAVLTGKRTQHNGYIYRYSGQEPPEPITVMKTQGRTTAQYDLQDNLIAIYPSAIQAAIAIGKDKGASRNIRSACSGNRLTAYGFKWKFLD